MPMAKYRDFFLFIFRQRIYCREGGCGRRGTKDRRSRPTTMPGGKEQRLAKSIAVGARGLRVDNVPTLLCKRRDQGMCLCIRNGVKYGRRTLPFTRLTYPTKCRILTISLPRRKRHENDSRGLLP